MFVFDLQVAHRKQNHQSRGHEEDHPEKQEKWVDHNRAIEAAHCFRAKRPQPVQRNAAEDYAEHGKDGVARFVLYAQHEVEKQDGQAEKRKLHFRQD